MKGKYTCKARALLCPKEETIITYGCRVRNSCIKKSGMYSYFTVRSNSQPCDHDPYYEKQFVTDQSFVWLNAVFSDDQVKKLIWIPSFANIGKSSRHGICCGDSPRHSQMKSFLKTTGFKVLRMINMHEVDGTSPTLKSHLPLQPPQSFRLQVFLYVVVLAYKLQWQRMILPSTPTPCFGCF